MTRDPAIVAVTFDYWNTIMRPSANPVEVRVEAWHTILTDAGHDVSTELIRAAFEAEWVEHHAAWHRNEQYTGERAARGAIVRMGFEPSAPLADSLVHAFGAASSRVELCPGVDDALHALHDRGVRLGIICDVGFTPSSVLRALLDRSGLLTVFTGWSFSDEVGCYKPGQEIFRHALGYLDVAPERAAHIGDLRRTDIAGARAMGMTSVRYTAIHDDPDDGPEADHILSSYAALLPLLGF